MKIAILSLTSGTVSRGAETFVANLSRELSRRHQLTVISAQTLNYFGPLFWFTLKALRATAAREADIIMPVNGGWQSFFTRIYCWLTGKKMVIAGLAGLGICDGWNLLMRPEAFVASTRRNTVWAKQFYGRGVSIATIPHGVDLDFFQPEGKKQTINLTKPIILCVAGPDRYKRVEATIKAVQELKSASLLLVGASDEDENLGKQLLKRRFQRITAGYEALPQIYRAADVFTMVSESTEEFGIVYLEALASGLPVVGTDDELRREILGPYGIYVQDVWGKEYTDKLKQALKQPKYRPEAWLRQFSWTVVARQYEAVFSRALSRGKAPALR